MRESRCSGLQGRRREEGTSPASLPVDPGVSKRREEGAPNAKSHTSGGAQPPALTFRGPLLARWAPHGTEPWLPSTAPCLALTGKDVLVAILGLVLQPMPLPNRCSIWLGEEASACCPALPQGLW